MSTNIFLRLDDIKGESTDDAHTDQIDVFNYSQGSSRPMSHSGSSGSDWTPEGKADFEPLVITKDYDAASPHLAMYLCNGTEIPTAEIEICSEIGGEKKVYLRYKFERLFVNSLSTTGGGTDRPTETVTFAFNKITWVYTPKGTDAETEKNWNLAKGISE